MLIQSDDLQRFESLALRILQMIVENPRDVAVAKLQHEGCIFLTATVHAEDIQLLLGPAGRTITALRHILSSIAKKYGVKVTLELADRL